MQNKSKLKVVHVNNKLIEKAFNNFCLPENNPKKISQSDYVNIVSLVFRNEDLKNGYIKL